MKKNFLLKAVLLFLTFWLYSNETPIKSLYSYKLDNGLSLFVAENHDVPLTYIEIAFRCGAYTQTPENVGIFHLYEHMLFKGNSLYKNASEVDYATTEMGVSDRNGTTDVECVNYFFTVPSELTQKGLEFWNAAIRFPNFDKKEFENEKKVVISEINGKNGDPSYQVYKAQQKLLFPENQHTLDSAGVEDFITKATIKQLKNIKKKFYIPNNSALFVAGDVNPDEVYQMVKKIFGSWKKGKNPFENGTVRHTQTPFSEPILLVQPLDTISPDLAFVNFSWRGPDLLYNRDDSYPADFLLKVLNQPAGLFKNTIINDGAIGIPSPDYIGTGYYSRKTCGVMNYWSGLVLPEQDIPERVLYLKSQLNSYIKKTIESLTDEDFEVIKTQIEDDDLVERATAFSLIKLLRSWWIVADEDYYYDYSNKLQAVTKESLLDFVDKYFESREPLITVTLNPGVYEKTKEAFEKSGFRLCLEK